MPRHLKKEYVAALAVRVYLSRIGMNKWSSKIKINKWHKILDEHWNKTKKYFKNTCAYCGISESKLKGLQRDHLISINKESCGLDHPANIIPSCPSCNNRNHDLEWQKKLKRICKERGQDQFYEKRKQKILNHPSKSGYKYPKIDSNEMSRLKRNASAIYRKITALFA